MSLIPALYVCCLQASFSFSLFSAVSHCSARLFSRACTASSEPAHLCLSIRAVNERSNTII
ncbi:hypothetical protein DPMN_155725 [Dreissena polymorpha]|uniref:Uncharacterized protein n=1 Tax=Dreissena polymorpha TaxID=45954 RepID=A0A9D4JBM4_DREPO|nr:hypothetical protein DPMN_155725 [Dreissena polymorpha]